MPEECIIYVCNFLISIGKKTNENKINLGNTNLIQKRGLEFLKGFIMKIEQNIPLNDKNWFCTGGFAKYFCEPTNEGEFVEAVKFAKEKDLEIFVLGEGANVLVSDDGFDGLIIRPRLLNLEADKKNELVSAGAGVSFKDVINFSLDNNLVGLEEFSGIPGCIGGTVCMNIHYLDFLLNSFFISGRVVDTATLQVLTVDNSWFEFGYDQSKLQEKRYFLTSATFKLKKVDDLGAAYAKGRCDETIRHRMRRYPRSNTCGSFFRNFHDDEAPVINGKKMPYIAYFLDRLGIKGELQVGNAIVSHQHANMIVTLPNATSQDVVDLVCREQKMVLDQFGVLPNPECQLVGFKKYPFLKN